MKSIQRILCFGSFYCATMCGVLLAQPPENTGGLQVTIQPTNAIISVNATNIPSTVTIENLTKEYVKFFFLEYAMVTDGSNVCESVIFEVPSGGKVQLGDLRPLRVGAPYIFLHSGEKHVGKVNLGDFLEFTEAGEYEVGFRGNLRIWDGNDRGRDRSHSRVVPFHGTIKVNVVKPEELPKSPGTKSGGNQK